MENDYLLQTINQLNETIKILQRNIVTKDATILALKQAINKCSSVTIPPTQPPMVIVVPSSDEIDQHRGEVAELKTTTSDN